ncbi:MAG: dienelactone hydrolase family protein [Verrucomicrobiota bacterium]
MNVFSYRRLLLCTLLVWGGFAGWARAGELVSLYEFGADEMGYLSLPETQPQGSILMVPDAFGPRGVVQQRCDLMAKLGYVTLVVDLYNGTASENSEVADRLQRKLEREVAVPAIQAGIKLLSESPRYETDTLIVAAWGENFPLVFEAAAGMKTFTPDAVSWLEPEGLQGLTATTTHRVPLQLVLRQETLGETNQAGLTRFNQLRDMDGEITIIDQQRGFLLNPKSTPEGVEGWTALIDFWQKVVDGGYTPQVIAGGEALRGALAAPEVVPPAAETRTRPKHPRLN